VIVGLRNVPLFRNESDLTCQGYWLGITSTYSSYVISRYDDTFYLHAPYYLIETRLYQLCFNELAAIIEVF
jgi:hypothetical protein